MTVVFSHIGQVEISRLVEWLKENITVEVEFVSHVTGVDTAKLAARYLVVYAPPTRVIAGYVAGGASFSEALTSWREGAQALLAFIRRHRSSVVLADVGVFQTDPAAMVKALRSNVVGKMRAAKQLAMYDEPDQFQMFLAAEALRRDRSVMLMVSELIASTAFKPQADAAVDLDALLVQRAKADSEIRRLLHAQVATEKSREAAAAKLDEGIQERDALLAKLLEAQARLDAYSGKLDGLGEKRTALEKQLEAANTNLRTACEKLAAISAQQDGAQTQITELTLALEAERDLQNTQLTEVARTWQTTVTALERQLAEGREEQDAILGELLRTQENLATRQAEAQQLEARLFQLRQGFEATEAQLRQRDGTTGRQDTNIRKLTAELQMFSGSLAERHDDLARAQIEIAERDAEIARVLSSRSFRVAAPLRWLRRAMSRERWSWMTL